jgi:hypothetical protein
VESAIISALEIRISINCFQLLLSEFNLRRYTMMVLPECGDESTGSFTLLECRDGKAVQVDSIKTRVESAYAYGFSA